MTNAGRARPALLVMRVRLDANQQAVSRIRFCWRSLCVGCIGSPVKRRSCCGAVAVVTGFAIGYSAVVRPRLLRWGASDEEVHGSLPGCRTDSQRPVCVRREQADDLSDGSVAPAGVDTARRPQ